MKVAPFASAWAQVTHAQLETSASQALNATAGLIQGDTTNLQTYLDAQAALIAPQLFPLPEFVTIEFDVYIRAQIQVNGGGATVCPPENGCGLSPERMPHTASPFGRHCQCAVTGLDAASLACRHRICRQSALSLSRVLLFQIFAIARLRWASIS